MEIGKKETRKGEPMTVRLKTFLKIYNESDIYMVQDAFESMKGMSSLEIHRVRTCNQHIGFVIIIN